MLRRRAPALVTLLATLLLVVLAPPGCEVSSDREGRPDARRAGDADADAGAGAGDAWRPLCEPGATDCDGLARRVCSPSGDRWVRTACPPGAGCVAGACEIAHPRLLFVFDTSSSMLGPAAGGALPSLPECGSIEAPGSRIAESKALFRQLFAEALPTGPRMGLLRFPQRATAAPECEAASYGGASALSGDDGGHAAPWTRGSWFRTNLSQVLVVPLAAGADEDGRAALVSWLDGEERVVQANKACTADGECGQGFCSGGTCWRYLAPELRAAGGTPLGKTLFYAGEYYRHAVLVDGQPCRHDAECASPGYRCGADGTCEDPLAACRANHIMVFSDGEETAHPDPGDFFHPLVQARRLRYGLGCQRDRECLAGATCVAGSCRPPGEPPAAAAGGGADAGRLARLLAYVDPLGAQRLETAAGRTVSVQVHALDVWGNPDSELLAWLGGGEYVPGALSDPEAVLWAMDLLLQSKGEQTQCR
jgi:hypothetical protein